MLYISKLRRFSSNSRGASAIEFALLAAPFFLILVGILEMGLKSIQQTDLDTNVYAIASKIATTQFDASDADKFSEDFLCTEFSFSVLDCNKVEIGIKAVSWRMFDYRNASIVNEWDIGCQDDTIIVELNYPVTHILHNFAVADVVTVNGKEYFRSRGVVRREPFLAGGVKC